MEKITCKSESFYDEYGRERIFYGIALCDKGMRKKGEKSYKFKWDQAILDNIQKSGFNVVRLGITWDQVEPEPQRYDEDYINIICETLEELEKRNIYVFIDMHQDLYSGLSGVGDGAPEWACLTDGYKFKPYKYVWAEGYYFNRAVHRCFDNFWNNKTVPNFKGVMDMYCDMLSFLAKRFSAYSNIMGWDVMNEPYAGSIGAKIFRTIAFNSMKIILTERSIKKTELLKNLIDKNNRHKIFNIVSAHLLRKAASPADNILKEFDKRYYSLFLSKATQAIRKETQNGSILIEGNYFSNIGLPSGTPKINVNDITEINQAYTPHGYDIVDGTPYYKYASSERIGLIFSQHRLTQKRLNVPVIVGEWGGYTPGTDWHFHLKDILAIFDSYHWSSTYYAYIDNFFKLEISDVLKRPYPEAVSGKIEEYSYDYDKKLFYLSFNQDSNIDKPTVIKAPMKIKKIETNCKYEIKENEVIVFGYDMSSFCKIIFK